MRCIWALVLVLNLGLVAGEAQPVKAEAVVVEEKVIERIPPKLVEVKFSPKGGCTEAIIKEVDQAKERVLVQAYNFTSEPIATSLTKAIGRGVKVVVILDRSGLTERKGKKAELEQSGASVVIDSHHRIAHNKVMVIDGKTVVTGSFNFTANAEFSNAENVIILRDAALAKQYTDNWQVHFDHSVDE